MLTIRPLAKWCLTLTLVFAGCATMTQPQVGHDEGPTTLRVTNQSPELARLYFVYEGAETLPMGTVPPYSTATFITRLFPNRSGNLVVRRYSEDAPTMMQSAINTSVMAGRKLDVMIASIAAFDHWR